MRDCRGRPGRKQVTLLFIENWHRALGALDPEAPWTVRRTTLLIGGFANPRRRAGILRLSAVRLRITGEATPCMRRTHSFPA